MAALVETFSADSLMLRLVNVSQTETRLVTVQGGAYGEHQLLAVAAGDRTAQVDARAFNVRLAPGCGSQLVIQWKRHANQPTLRSPWDR